MDGGLEQARSLREIFASMSHGSADPATALAQAGHGDLPGHLVTEAVISYADSAPVEVAEHLQPYVVANSAVPAPDGYDHPGADVPDAFSLLTSAPVPLDVEPGHDPYDVHAGDQHSLLDDGLHHDLHDGLHDPLHDGFHDTLHDTARDAADHDAHHGDGGQTDLWFGHGQAAALEPHALADPLAAADDTAQPHYADAGHSDPWLVDAHDSVPEHAGDDGLALWNPDVHATDPAGHDLDQAPHEHPPVPLEDPASHDLPIDPGHA